MAKSSSSIFARAAWLLVTAAVCAIDQLTKSAARHFLEARPGREFPVLKNHIDLVYRFNTGGAFSLFENRPGLFLVLPAILIIVILFLLLNEKARPRGRVSALGLSLILGGAVGNIIDRIRMGRVFDFIDCHMGMAHWPAFNAADSAIVCGVALFAFALLRGGRPASD